jgi:uncharacterized membrane protein YfcA
MYFLGSLLIFPIWFYNGLGNINDIAWSFILLFPAVIGQKIGTKIRDQITNKTFKTIILYILILIGALLLIKNI